MLYRRFGLPYLVYVHGEELNFANKSRELHWMMRRVYRNSRFLIANSHNTACLLRDDWSIPANRVYVLHPGVDTARYHPTGHDSEVRRRLGWGDRPVILTVGRLQERKGHEQIVRALPVIRQQVPEVLYAIVGAGDQHARLKQITAELALEDCVTFHGEIDNNEVLSAYQQCDVFALPNRIVHGDFEGFGIVLLEAQACGKPVVTGDSGGTVEAVHAPHSGRIVRAQHPEELAETLIELLSDAALRERMGQAGRRWVVENFDWNQLVAQAAGLFAQVGPSGEPVQPPNMPAESTGARTNSSKPAQKLTRIG
jgi:phosphatidylinositol alpha-1,6-mannosyltransferase